MGKPKQAFNTMSARSSESILVDLYFTARAVPPSVDKLNEWIAEVQRMYAFYRRAKIREKRDTNRLDSTM